MQVIDLQHSTQDLDGILNQVQKQDTTLLVNAVGEEFVLMSKKEWDSWQETLYLMSNPVNAARVREGIRQIKAGQTIEKKLHEL